MVITRSDSDIYNLEELQGAVIASPPATDFSGVQAQLYEYRQRVGRDLIDDVVMVGNINLVLFFPFCNLVFLLASMFAPPPLHLPIRSDFSVFLSLSVCTL